MNIWKTNKKDLYQLKLIMNLTDRKIISISDIFYIDSDKIKITEFRQNLNKVKDIEDKLLESSEDVPAILIDQNYNIIDGHHRYIASKNLEIKIIPVIKIFTESSLQESVTIPLSKNDTILFGKWKNKKAIVTGFSKDDKGQPVIKTDQKDLPLLGVRLTKESVKLLNYKRLS